MCYINRARFYLQFRNLRNHFKKEQDDLNSVKSRLNLFAVTLFYYYFFFLFFFCSKEDSACTAPSHSSVKRFDGRNVNRMKRGRFLLYTKWIKIACSHHRFPCSSLYWPQFILIAVQNPSLWTRTFRQQWCM